MIQHSVSVSRVGFDSGPQLLLLAPEVMSCNTSRSPANRITGLLDWWRQHSLIISLLVTGEALAGAIFTYLALMQTRYGVVSQPPSKES